MILTLPEFLPDTLADVMRPAVSFVFNTTGIVANQEVIFLAVVLAIIALFAPDVIGLWRLRRFARSCDLQTRSFQSLDAGP